jgi:nucleotide-binding universal stress UspA family protein
LAVIERAANDAGVACDTTYVTAHHAYEAIIQAAEEKGCDCIVMASHGRHGVQALLIGSETAKVLTHTKLPVLVLH